MVFSAYPVPVFRQWTGHGAAGAVARAGSCPACACRCLPQAREVALRLQEVVLAGSGLLRPSQRPPVGHFLSSMLGINQVNTKARAAIGTAMAKTVPIASA